MSKENKVMSFYPVGSGSSDSGSGYDLILITDPDPSPHSDSTDRKPYWMRERAI
mgnify:CR=1 FL=1